MIFFRYFYTKGVSLVQTFILIYQKRKMMKKLVLIFFAAVIANASSSAVSDVEAIKKVINDSYVDGIHNRGSANVIRQGFHPDFEMLVFRDNKLEKLPIESWIANVEKQKKENPGPPEHRASAKYHDVDVTGNAAVAKLELYRQGQKLFTDYLILYKFNDGWRMVSKIYYRH
jgi:hypothetical protein